ncbi:C39 family peptidase [Cellvibrio fontiphilus]|uniref:C39 family peptidase n=1 Tax=Cellvibrio fontiphilus TaxID=1815559 RepID=A0ABV7FIY9_9GAMM
MNKKIIISALTFSCAFSAAVNAEIIHCKNAAGKLVYTDNPRNCADKHQLPQTVKITQTESFYNEIPDLLQTLNKAGFAGDGQQFCAPVAVSNSLVWLEDNKDEQYQIELVHKLSSAAYMNTNTNNGTSVYEVAQGVHKYATERWGSYKTLQYSGWRPVAKQFRSGQQPTVDWMTSALHRKGAVWLNVGWYNRNGTDYQRAGGHWVTLVGYEQGKLIIHDPAPRAGQSFSNQYITLEPISGGKLIHKQRITPAQGYFVIADGMYTSSKGSLAVLDGAVKFELY